MLVKSLFAFAHFAAAFGLVATLFFEWFTFSRMPSVRDARRLALADRWYGISAMVLLVAGAIRAYAYEKGLDYYLANPFFLLKMALFVSIGLLSIAPTLRFLRWRPDIRAGRAPVVSEAQYTLVARCLSAQMLALAFLLLSASLMANGIGS
jgi:putative membrane protein